MIKIKELKKFTPVGITRESFDNLPKTLKDSVGISYYDLNFGHFIEIKDNKAIFITNININHTSNRNYRNSAPLEIDLDTFLEYFYIIREYDVEQRPIAVGDKLLVNRYGLFEQVTCVIPVYHGATYPSAVVSNSSSFEFTVFYSNIYRL